jgi:hypothetical protein
MLNIRACQVICTRIYKKFLGSGEMSNVKAEKHRQWDEVAKSIYGTEFAMHPLMEHNMCLLDIFQFGGGELITVPPADAAPINLPPWKR